MKKSLTTFAASLVITAFFISSATAQEMAATSINSKKMATNEMIALNSSTASDAVATSVSSIGNTRLAAKFAAKFPAAQQQQWSVTNKGYWVSFENEGRKTRAGFNSNGQLNYTVEDCVKDQLSAPFQNFIAKNYVGYQFLSAISIKAFGEQTEQAILENAAGFVTLNFNEEGTQEINKISKAK